MIFFSEAPCTCKKCLVFAQTLSPRNMSLKRDRLICWLKSIFVTLPPVLLLVTTCDPKVTVVFFKREATSIDYFGRPTWHLARIFFHIAFGRENENKCLFFWTPLAKNDIFLAEVRRQKVTLSLIWKLVSWPEEYGKDWHIGNRYRNRRTIIRTNKHCRDTIVPLRGSVNNLIKTNSTGKLNCPNLWIRIDVFSH